MTQGSVLIMITCGIRRIFRGRAPWCWLPLLFLADVCLARDCIHYETYLHLTGNWRAADSVATALAFQAPYVYLASGPRIHVIDVTDTTAPLPVGNVEIPGEVELTGAAIAGSYLYVTSVGGRLWSLDIAAPTAPTVASQAACEGCTFRGLAVNPDLAFVAAADSGLWIFDLSDPGAPVALSSLLLPGSARRVAAQDSWVLVAAQAGGLQSVDVEDPAAPFTWGGVPGIEAYDVTIDGDFAYVAGAETGLHVIDITAPESPWVAGHLVAPCRSVRIGGDRAYLGDPGSGLAVLDLAAPAQPVLQGAIATLGEPQMLAAEGPIVYVADGPAGLSVIQAGSGRSAPFVGSEATLDHALGIAVQAGHAYVAAANAGLQIIELSRPGSPTTVGDLDLLGRASGVAAQANFAYVTVGQVVRVVDITAADNPQPAGLVSLADSIARIAINSPYIYAAVRDSGLQILEVRPLDPPLLRGRAATEGTARDVAIGDDLAYLITSAGLELVDVTLPTSPIWIGRWDVPGAATALCLQGDSLYVAAGPAGLQIWDLGTPLTPQLVVEYPTLTPARGVAVAGDFAYVTGEGDRLWVFAVAGPGDAQRRDSVPLIGGVTLPASAEQILWLFPYLYLAAGADGLQIAWRQCGGPLPVTLRRFDARFDGATALVRWEVTPEAAGWRYDLWREEAGGGRIRLNHDAFTGGTTFAFTDPAAPRGGADYWLRAEDHRDRERWWGPATLRGLSGVDPILLMSPNVPNPFNPRTTITAMLDRPGRVRLSIYDLRGRRIVTLVEDILPAGDYRAVWDGRDGQGRPCPSGVYVARLECEGRLTTRKLALAR
jgi:hypothetical protein